MKKTAIICLPYAGGSAVVYSKWQDKMGEELKIIPIELAGRGKRFGTKAKTSIYEIVNDIYPEFKRIAIDNRDFVVFGHSMGAILTYTLVEKLYNETRIKPKHVYFSGQDPLHYLKKEYYYELEKPEFKKYLSDLGGMPDEILEDDEIFDIFSPTIIADLKAVNTFNLNPYFKPLESNISVLYSKGDSSINPELIEEWKKYTTKNCMFHEFKGNHFFIDQEEDQVIETIRMTANQ